MTTKEMLELTGRMVLGDLKRRPDRSAEPMVDARKCGQEAAERHLRLRHQKMAWPLR